MKIKHLLSFALALSLLIVMLQGAIPSALAEENNTATITQTTVGSKGVMEVSLKIGPANIAHDGVVFSVWGNDEAFEQYRDDSKTSSNCLPLVAGCYYLEENVVLSDTWVVPEGETSLCLNGMQINRRRRF